MTIYRGRIQLQQHPSADWALNDAVLLPGQIGAADVGTMLPILKIGDGVRPWSMLPNLVGAGGGGSVAFADPSAQVGLMTRPGVSTYAMRADAAPPLDQTIAPVWTALHTFNLTPAVPNKSWTYQKIQDVTPSRLLGRISASAGVVEELNGAQVASLLEVFTDTLKGVVPASGGGTANFLRADGTFAIPPGIAAPVVPGVPTASVALAPINGVASTFMRSDAAPALDITIAPTWTGQHTFNLTPAVPNDSWTFAKIQNIASARVLGRVTAGNGDIEELTGAQLGVIAGVPAAGNPTATVALAAKNGAAITFMRSDAAPALDQTIAPTWTQKHIFARNRTSTGEFAMQLASTVPVIFFTAQTAAADAKNWLLYAYSGGFSLGAANDADSTLTNVITVARTGTTIDSIALNATIVNTSNHINVLGGAVFLRSQNSLSDLNDGYLRLASDAAHFSNGVFAPTNIRSTGRVMGDTGFGDSTLARTLTWGVSPGALYGSIYLSGSGNVFTGYGINDGALAPIFMSNGVNCGIYTTADGKWHWYRANATLLTSEYNISAPSFNASSSRKLKRITGTPSRAADILSRLRPILYRLLADPKDEQIGLIAEEVHEICPWLSRDGKSVTYDRGWLLILAALQEMNFFNSVDSTTEAA